MYQRVAPSWFITLWYFSIVADVAGLGLALLRRKALDPPRYLPAAWLSTDLLGDIAQDLSRRLYHTTQLVAQVSYLPSVIIAFGMFAALTADRKSRAAYGAAGAVFVFMWVGLMLTTEQFGNYTTYVGPLNGLFLMGGAAFIFMRRGLSARRDLMRDPAFLMSSGMLIYATPSVLLSPVAMTWMKSDPQAVLMYYGLRLAISGVGLLIMCGAFLVGARRESRPTLAPLTA